MGHFVSYRGITPIKMGRCFIYTISWLRVFLNAVEARIVSWSLKCMLSSDRKATRGLNWNLHVCQSWASIIKVCIKTLRIVVMLLMSVSLCSLGCLKVAWILVHVSGRNSSSDKNKSYFSSICLSSVCLSVHLSIYTNDWLTINKMKC